MSMEPEQDNFQQLRRLLALKRHEQPPPGYFDALPGQIFARLRARDWTAEPSVLDRLSREAPWLRRLWSVLEHKPILAGIFAASLCVVLISGIVYTENSQPTPVSLLPAPEQPSQPALAAASEPTAAPGFTPVSALESPGAENPLPVAPSLFQEVRQKQNQELWLNLQPASKTSPAPPGN